MMRGPGEVLASQEDSLIPKAGKPYTAWIKDSGLKEKTG